MALPRPACLRGAVRRSTLRRAGAPSRSNTLRQGGRRTYASGHEAKKSSDLPWIVGSAVVTIPAATWLLGQTPTKSDHTHHETEAVVVHEGERDEEGGDEEPKQEEGGDDSKDESQGEEEEQSKSEAQSEEPKEEGKDEGKSDDSGSDDEGKDTPPSSSNDDDEAPDHEKPSEGSPGQINKLGQSSGLKDRPKTEKKGEKDSASTQSGAQHPYINTSDKSRKFEGVAETAKIHGTVDPKNRSTKE